MFYLILISFLTVCYFWIINAKKSGTTEDTSGHTYENNEESESEKLQHINIEITYLAEDDESFESLSNEVELGFQRISPEVIIELVDIFDKTSERIYAILFVFWVRLT